MQDKLEIRVPVKDPLRKLITLQSGEVVNSRMVPFTREFEDFYMGIQSEPKSPFHQTRHYTSVGDLRPYGYPVILHLHSKQGKGDHKVEFIDTGKHGMSFLLGELERMFVIDPMRCELMRIDCAADIPDVPVHWFMTHVCVRWKQFNRAIFGEVPDNQSQDRMGKMQLQTLYYGMRPNCVRVYDKVAEWASEFRKGERMLPNAMALRMVKAGATPEDVEWKLRLDGFNPDAEDCGYSFEDVFGVPMDAVLTRCERQIGGGEVPKIPVSGKPRKEWDRLQTVGEWRKRGLEFNPYSDFKMYPGGLSADDLPEEARGLRQAIEWQGLHFTNGDLKKKFNRHTPRRLFGPNGIPWVLPPDDDCKPIDINDLYDSYRDSLSKQFAA